MEGNRIKKKQIIMLQEALKIGKQEWQSMKIVWQSMKELITTNRDVIISKKNQVDTQVS